MMKAGPRGRPEQPRAMGAISVDHDCCIEMQGRLRACSIARGGVEPPVLQTVPQTPLDKSLPRDGCACASLARCIPERDAAEQLVTIAYLSRK